VEIRDFTKNISEWTGVRRQKGQASPMEKLPSSTNNQSNKHKYSTSLAVIFPAIFGIRWVFQLIKEWDSLPYRNLKIVIAFAAFFVFVLAVVLVDDLLARAGIQRPIRSGVWASVILGPVIGLEAFSRWGQPVWSQIIGFTSAVLAFGMIYLLDKARHGA
jgi:hypothetical protein